MRHFFFLWYFLISGLSFSQTITGTVREKGTGLPLPFANVFISNTTLGAATDVDGKFVIQGNVPDQFELVASFVGYSTVSHTIERQGRQAIFQKFELEFLEDNLTEVELKAKRDRSWERNLKMFKEVFLAIPEDIYGNDIEILNPWVLDFESIKQDTSFNYIQGTANQPLKILNKALGYQIEYYLQDFRMYRGGASFFGQSFYKDLPTDDSLVNKKWKEAKEFNYRNSARHFALSLLLKNTISQGFDLYEASAMFPKEDRTDDFYYEIGKSIIPVKTEFIYTKPLGNGTYRIFLPERIEVHHLNKGWLNDYYTNIYHAISWIVAPSGFFDVDRNGTLLHPTQLVVSGYMGRQRVARSLPLDFLPDEGFTDFIEDFQVFKSRYLTLNNLREKPWLSTNKTFYYPGETIWLGGIMNYQNALMQDTLSRVVYVDVLNDQLKPLYQETFPIKNGKISGGLILSDTLGRGNYLLRAYTRWSLNYGEMDIFELPFPILDSNEILQLNKLKDERVFGELDVISEFSMADSSTFRVMDLVLKVQDDLENLVDANFLVSVLEENYAAEVDPKYQLESMLEWLDKDLPETFDSEMLHPVEYGISVEGKFFPKKKRGDLATGITLVQGELHDYGMVNSDSSGRFWTSGFQFQDTSQIAIAAFDEKMRSFGSVELVPFKRPLFMGSFPRSSYQVLMMSEETKAFSDFSQDYILLEEFVKEEMKTSETMAERNYGYGEPTQQVGPDKLERQTMGEILGYLGFNLSTLKFRNFTYGEKTGTPLLIIDGSPMPFMDPNEFRITLLGFEPSQLESIKAYSDNMSKPIFGMAGYAGVIMIETKNGFRTGPDSDRKFNSEGFQIFPVKGFSSFSEFPKNPPSDQYLKKKPTIYWEPDGQTMDGIYQTKVKVPYGVNQLRIRVEGRTVDGEAFSKVLRIKI